MDDKKRTMNQLDELLQGEFMKRMNKTTKEMEDSFVALAKDGIPRLYMLEFDSLLAFWHNLQNELLNGSSRSVDEWRSMCAYVYRHFNAECDSLKRYRRQKGGGTK